MLRDSARKEFEKSKFEKDPQKIAELLVTGRDSLQQIVDKVINLKANIVDGGKTTTNFSWQKQGQ